MKSSRNLLLTSPHFLQVLARHEVHYDAGEAGQERRSRVHASHNATQSDQEREERNVLIDDVDCDGIHIVTKVDGRSAVTTGVMVYFSLCFRY